MEAPRSETRVSGWPGVDWTVTSKKMHPNSDLPVPVSVILFGKRMFVDVTKLRISREDHSGLTGWVTDQCPHKIQKRKLGHGGESHVKTGGAVGIMTPQPRNVWNHRSWKRQEGLSSGTFRGNVALLTSWFWASCLQDGERQNFWYIKTPNILLQLKEGSTFWRHPGESLEVHTHCNVVQSRCTKYITCTRSNAIFPARGTFLMKNTRVTKGYQWSIKLHGKKHGHFARVRLDHCFFLIEPWLADCR